MATGQESEFFNKKEWLEKIQYVKENYPDIHILWSEDAGYAYLSYKGNRLRVLHTDTLEWIIKICKRIS